MGIVNVRIHGKRDVFWCERNMTLEPMSSTTSYDWSNTYDKYIEVILENGDRITITEDKLLEEYYENSQS